MADVIFPENSELNPRVRVLVDEWLELDKNPTTRAEIETLVQEASNNELLSRLGSRMPFGTAGLRALMGAGYSRMNDLTIIQTCQGLVCHLLEQFGEQECASRGVVIGYDARHNSLRFAELSAAIMLHKGIKVYLFSKYTPTPFTPYAVRKYNCVAGIQVTASHNAKQYNGYKVYWDNGAQIIPPLDGGIQNQINKNLTPWPTSWDTTVIKGNSKIIDPLAEVEEGYFSELRVHCHRKAENCSPCVKFTYTAMHGVGGEWVVKAFEEFGFSNLIITEEQMVPDPEFPTVKFPNPEEGKGALHLAMKTADAAGSVIILANDPDADRLALAEKDPSSGSWRVFSGNEIGTLLGWWVLRNHKEKNKSFDGSKVHMLASTVSSKFLRSMAEIEGIKFEETLTGFKWMGNRTYQLLHCGHEVLFAYEEAIGFMVGTSVLDKDGISAAAVVAEYGGWLYSQGKTFSSQLEELFHRYGRFKSEVSYFFCYSKETIDKLFSSLREERKYPVTCGGANVISVVDLTIGYDSTRPPDYKPVLPVDPGCHLITFTLDNHCVFTLRTSGTEPKIKYYVEVSSSPGSGTTAEELQATLDKMVGCIVSELLQPEHFGLIPRSP